MMILETCGNCGKQGDYEQYRDGLCKACRKLAVLVVEDEVQAALRKPMTTREALARDAREDAWVGTLGEVETLTFEQIRAIYLAGVRTGAAEASIAVRELFHNKGVMKG